MQEPTQESTPRVPYANVHEAVRAYASQWLSWHTTALVIPTLLVAALAGWALFAETDPWRSWLQLLWIPAMVGVLVWGYFRAQGIALFYQGIAAAWHWQYAASLVPAGYAATLFSVGHGQILRNMMGGTVGGARAFIANLEYTVGSGKSAHTYTNTVAMLALSDRVPHVLLAVDKDRFDSQVLSRVRNFEAVPLEGAFEDRVGLYVQSGFELEALQIIHVAMLEKLGTTWSKYSLEFVGSELYVYAPRVLSTRDEVEELLSLLHYASEELGPRLRHMQGSLRAMREATAAKKV
ncbi:MAG: hypothetical protein JNK33_03060 [Candidatus Doudnabacteria bacterium]|nr:hypothetical protein [Candidatus Doudnabacteria bacterium]